MSTIVCFEIGRGGRFHNSGHVSFIRYADDINKFTDDLFIYYENGDSVLRKIGDRPNLRSKFEKCQDNDDFSFFEKLGFDLGDKYYYSGGGHCTGLEVDNDGTGTIDIDGDYNTTYCKSIADCDEKEIRLIIEDEPYNLIKLLEEFGYENVEVFEAFSMLDEMVECDVLSYHCIEEITEDEFCKIGDEQETRSVGDKFYKRY